MHYGSPSAGALATNRALVLQLLYHSCVIATGSTTLADLWQHGQNKEVKATATGVDLRFESRDVGWPGTTSWLVKWDWKRQRPIELTQASPRFKRLVSYRYGAKGELPDEVNVSMESSLGRKSLRYFDISAKPLLQSPPSEAYRLAVGYNDAMTGAYVPAAKPGGTRPSKEEQERIIQAARAKIPTTFKYQTGKLDCGILSAFYTLRLKNKAVNLDSLYAEFPDSSYGTSLAHVTRAIEKRGLACQVIRSKGRRVESLKNPCIVSIIPSHFVVFCGVQNGKVTILDPSAELTNMPVRDFELLWDGVALLVD